MSQLLDNQPLDLKGIIREFLSYWKLYALLMFIAGVLAVAYVKVVPRAYSVGGIILFNTQDGNRTKDDASKYLEGYDMVTQDKNFKNEILFFRSSVMIKEVLKDMKLEVSYYAKSMRIPEISFIGYNNIFESNPFTIIADKNHSQPINTVFKIEILNDESYSIMAYNPEADLYNYLEDEVVAEYAYFELLGVYKFGQEIKTDECSFTVILNPNFEKYDYSDKDLYFIFNNLEGLALAFQENLYVKPLSLESTTAQIGFTAEHPVLAKKFVDNLIRKYINVNLDAKNKYANKTIEYIDRQLKSMSDSLGYTEKELENFRKDQGVVQLEEKSNQLYSRIDGLEQEEKAVQQQIMVLQNLKSLFESFDDIKNIVVPSGFGLEGDDLLNDLMTQLSQLKSEYDLIIGSGQLKNPRLKTLSSSISNLLETINENVAFNIRSNAALLKETRSKLASANKELALLPQKERKLLNIERKFNLTDAAYTSLLEKRMQAQIAKASSEPDCEIIEPTRFVRIASPNSKLILIMGLFIGFIIPTGYILLKNFFSLTINRLNELPSKIKHQIIGYLPNTNLKGESVVNDKPRSQITEAFLTLRSNIEYLNNNKPNQTILVTSSIPGEGKSFSALNLAISIAKSQQKTLIINFDLRKKRRYTKFVAQENEYGLSHYLINLCNLDDIISETDIPNLDIIDSGEVPESVIEMFSNQKIEELLNSVKDIYDKIIIDTPPYGLLTDAFVLMQFADIKLYIIRLGVAVRKTFEICFEDFENKGLNKDIHFIINSSGNKLSEVYYHKGPYYGDSDTRKFLGFIKIKKKKKV